MMMHERTSELHPSVERTVKNEMMNVTMMMMLQWWNGMTNDSMLDARCATNTSQTTHTPRTVTRVFESFESYSL
jgi:hypothetical protein